MAAITTSFGDVPHLGHVKKLAKHCDCSVSTIWSWTKTRPNFPQPIKYGPRVTLFDIGAVDAYLRSQGGAK